jgi:hypothetical protein
MAIVNITNIGAFHVRIGPRKEGRARRFSQTVTRAQAIQREIIDNEGSQNLGIALKGKPKLLPWH